MDDPRVSPESGIHPAIEEASGSQRSIFPTEILGLLDVRADSPADEAWDAFLSVFGDLLLRTAVYAHRDHDASMDAYAFILEKLIQDDYRRLRNFSGGDREAFTRWLAVVARRLCTDFWRHRYGRARPSTSDLDRDTRRRLVDEIWDPRQSSDLPDPRGSSPEWDLRLQEMKRALDSAVGDLEPRDQLILALRFENGLSARRISDLMGFPTPFHVYRQLNRVLANLRKRLKGEGVDGPEP